MKKIKTGLNLLHSKLEIVTIAFILLYTVAAIVVSLNRYWQYQSFYFDFGIYDTAIWAASRFQLPIVDHFGFGNVSRIIWADHFNPSIFLLSPLYWFTDKREVMLIAQALAVTISSFVGFLIARKYLKNKLAVLALVVAYLGYVGMQNALITEFHDSTIAVLPLMFVFWALFNKKWKIYFISLIILLGFKESFAGLGVALAAYLYFRKEIKIAILTGLISIAWGYLAINVIIPYFSQGIYLYSPSQLPRNLADLIKAFIAPPLKDRTIFYSYLTFGFLPLFDLSLALSIFENFFERFILAPSATRFDLGFHYNAPLTPLLFIASMYAFSKMEASRHLKKIVTVYALGIIFTVIFLHRFILHGPLGLFYNSAYYNQSNGVRYVDSFLKSIPDHGVIMTQNDLALRLSHQKDVKLLRVEYQKINPDFVVLNLTPGGNANGYYPLTYNQAKTLKDELLHDSHYKVDKYADELYIFSKLK